MDIGLDAAFRGYKLYRQSSGNFNDWVFAFKEDGFNLEDVNEVVNDMQR